MGKCLLVFCLFLGCENHRSEIIQTVPVQITHHIGSQNYLIKFQFDSLKQTIEEGNIVLRGGTDIESNIIRDFSYHDKLFSHCGICIKTDTGLTIAHMLGGQSNPNGGILYSTIEDFFSYPENESAGIYKINFTKKEKLRIKQYTDSVKQKNVDFDLKFDLFTKDKLYCTEMLIDAIRYAKQNSSIFPCSKFYLKNTKYFFLSNKADSFFFYPIDIFQHNSQLKEKRIFYFPNFYFPSGK